MNATPDGSWGKAPPGFRGYCFWLTYLSGMTTNLFPCTVPKVSACPWVRYFSAVFAWYRVLGSQYGEYHKLLYPTRIFRRHRHITAALISG